MSDNAPISAHDKGTSREASKKIAMFADTRDRYPTGTTMPEFWGDEDGERWWAQGHHSVVDSRIALGMAMALDFGDRITPEDRQECFDFAVNAQVERVWIKWDTPSGNDDPTGTRCNQNDPDAEPWTVANQGSD